MIVPLPHRLSTAEVYAEADRLGLRDDELEFVAKVPDLWSVLSPGARLPGRFVVNDLEPAAVSLCPDIEGALSAVRDAGADHAFVSGSGPTVAGLYWGPPAPPGPVRPACPACLARSVRPVRPACPACPARRGRPRAGRGGCGRA